MNDEQTPALRQAVENMVNMREAYDNLSQAAEAYNAGKTELAANITSKGIPASASETLPDLADKVAQIAQKTTIYEGADSYGKQIGAGGCLWDLYQVLADMKTRFMGTGDYAALIVCEYYKGYDSLVLQGADGYYTCDGDYYDYASPNHVWHDVENGKMNRWVAFLYRDEGARLDITNTDISPRSMYIGGHIGTIEYFTTGRLTELVTGVEETDVVDNFLQKGYTQDWGKNVFIKASNIYMPKFDTGVFVKIVADTIRPESGTRFRGCVYTKYQYIVIDNKEKIVCSDHLDAPRVIVDCDSTGKTAPAIGVVILGEVELGYGAGLIRSHNAYSQGGASNLNNLKFIYAPKYKKSLTPQKSSIIEYGIAPSLSDIMVGAFVTDLKISEWNPTNVLADATEKAQLIDNIKNHILSRVSDATGGTQLVFTVSTNMYNNIASEQIEWHGETMSLADAFLTKNWLLAGA